MSQKAAAAPMKRRFQGTDRSIIDRSRNHPHAHGGRRGSQRECPPFADDANANRLSAPSSVLDMPQSLQSPGIMGLRGQASPTRRSEAQLHLSCLGLA
jgi:hypothetical protein